MISNWTGLVIIKRGERRRIERKVWMDIRELFRYIGWYWLVLKWEEKKAGNEAWTAYDSLSLLQDFVWTVPRDYFPSSLPSSMDFHILLPTWRLIWDWGTKKCFLESYDYFYLTLISPTLHLFSHFSALCLTCTNIYLATVFIRL